VILHRVPLDHLRLGPEITVDCEKLVEHQQRVVARDVGARREGVEDRDIRLWHEAQGPLAGILRKRGSGRDERGGACRGGGPQKAST
ncbi:hypothetical protein, partial [Klebsiella pneumoniae]|uniref:hypothetical protein n=1 Tax=Klebsiella pneumoniae TaxID=573 RepID=UPI0027311D09